MTAYGEWLLQQAPDRQAASIANMLICKELGEEQRRAPHSDKCRELAAQVQAYYDKREPRHD